MLFSARKRKEDLAAREAAGESLWSDFFEESALVRIAEVWRMFADNLTSYTEPFSYRVGALLRIQAGRGINSVEPGQLPGMTDTELILDVLGAVHDVIKNIGPYDNNHDHFADLVNGIMREHRIGYKFVEGELIEFSSDELLNDVVEPALRLLVGNQFLAAHGAYMEALKEIGRGKPDDAITDAGAALQETLTALGCQGNALGPLIADARTRGLFAGHDQNLISGITKFMDWASADRSTTGDAHRFSDAAIADAWLMVHVVGALIVRLADPALRGTPSAG